MSTQRTVDYHCPDTTCRMYGETVPVQLERDRFTGEWWLVEDKDGWCVECGCELGVGDE